MENTALVVPEQIQHAIDTAMNDLTSYIETDIARSRIAHAVAVQIQGSELLLQCSPTSITIALAQIVMSGLDPRSPNEAFLVPYKKKDGTYEAVAQPGYAGLRKMGLRDPKVMDVWADKVHVNDEYTHDADGKPVHLWQHFKPRGETIGFYATAQLNTGRYITVEMSKEEVVKHRDKYSRAAQKEIWTKNFDSMAIKTCLRMLCHPRNMELPVEATQLIRNEAVNYGVRPGDTVDPVTGEVYEAEYEDKTPQEHIGDLYGDTKPAANPTPTPRDDPQATFTTGHEESDDEKRRKLVAAIGAQCDELGIEPRQFCRMATEELGKPFGEFTTGDLMDMGAQLESIKADRLAKQEEEGVEEVVPANEV